jgi:single-strand DNA-binding protein
MKSLNKVFLLGRAGHVPQLLSTKSGQSYTRLNVATRRSWKNPDNTWEERTDWHNVMVWGNQARTCSEGIGKGAVVFIEGQLTPYAVAGEDGKKETRQSIHATKVSFFSLPSRQVEVPQATETVPELTN